MHTFKCVTSLKEWWTELWCCQCLPRHSFLRCALEHCLICITFYYLKGWQETWVEAFSLVLFQSLTTPKARLHSCLGGPPVRPAISAPLLRLPWGQARAHQRGPKLPHSHTHARAQAWMCCPWPGSCRPGQESEQLTGALMLLSPMAQAARRARWGGGFLICCARVMVMWDPFYFLQGTTKKATVHSHTSFFCARVKNIT